MNKIRFKVLIGIITLIGISNLSFGQNEPSKEIADLQKDILKIKTENKKQESDIGSLKTKTQQQNESIDGLKKQVVENTSNIETTAKDLGIKITNTQTQSEQKITEVNESLSKNTLYWIIAILATALLSAIAYFLLNKRQNSIVQMQATDKFEVIDHISKTKKSLEEEGIKLDTKLTEILDTQLKLSKEDKVTNPTANNNTEPDHSLALKVADEIMRINKNISNMDPDTKGLKQLTASVNRIKDNFAANGYDMPELLGKPFNDGMKLIVASSIPNENLKKGEEIISRIIKPQVNFNGVMVQAAQVEVSIGQ
jgi:phage shock protein A